MYLYAIFCISTRYDIRFQCNVEDDTVYIVSSGSAYIFRDGAILHHCETNADDSDYRDVYNVESDGNTTIVTCDKQSYTFTLYLVDGKLRQSQDGPAYIMDSPTVRTSTYYSGQQCVKEVRERK